MDCSWVVRLRVRGRNKAQVIQAQIDLAMKQTRTMIIGLGRADFCKLSAEACMRRRPLASVMHTS